MQIFIGHSNSEMNDKPNNSRPDSNGANITNKSDVHVALLLSISINWQSPGMIAFNTWTLTSKSRDKTLQERQEWEL